MKKVLLLILSGLYLIFLKGIELNSPDSASKLTFGLDKSIFPLEGLEQLKGHINI